MNNGKHRTGAAAWPVRHDRGGMSVDERVEDHMLTLLKRHQVQTLLAAGHDQIEVADLAGVSVRRATEQGGAVPCLGCKSWWSRSTKRLAPR